MLRQRLDPQAAYALWAKDYPPHPHNALMEVEQRSMLSLLPDLAGRTVVDAGCGSGRYLRALRKLGASPIGIDLSGAMLARAQHETRRLARADLLALPIASTSVDVIVCGLALGDVRCVNAAIVELGRVLRPGGCLVYSVVHPIGGVKGWDRTFDVDGRRLAIDSYWHSADQHSYACVAAGLRITAWEEPAIDHAGPAVLVVRASR